MKKLVLTLVIILPLILLVAIFAVTSVTAITTQIPASGLIIGNKGDNGVFSFDMADYNSPMTEQELGIEVEPYVASNRDYTLTVTNATTSEPSDAVSVNDKGEFVLHDVGVSKLTYTSKDGGYTDSVLFNVTCSGVIDFTPQIMLENGTAVTLAEGTDTDYQATIWSGQYLLSQALYPTNLSFANVEYSTTGISVQADASSSMSAIFEGESVLSMTIKNPAGSSLDETITKTVKLNVQKCADVTINGLDATSSVTLSSPINQKTVNFYFELPPTLSKEDVSISGMNIQSTQIEQLSSNAYKATINLINAIDTAGTSASYKMFARGEEYPFSITYESYDFNTYSANALNGKADIVLLMGDDIAQIKVVAKPSDNIVYDFSIGNQEVATIASKDGDKCTLKPVANGDTVLTINWIAYDNSNSVIAQGSEMRNIVVASKYTSLLFNETAHSYGLGKLAIASQTFNEAQTIVASNRALGLEVYNGTQKLATLDDIVFTSSDESILMLDVVDNKFVPIIKKSGEVTVTASWKHGVQFGVKDAQLNFIAVDGVEVKTYNQLISANNAQKEIVLANDVYLGEDLFNHASDGSRSAKYEPTVMAQKLASYTSTLKTTADWTYYKNTTGEQPSVAYCFEFFNNFYGNGYMLNAEYITNMLDSSGNLFDYALFRGPLNFVSANSLASVKGQDNISFLVRSDNVTIYNTTLKGCDDKTLYEGGMLSLTWLNNMGTTLEIMADATVTNCRIQNGRTVLRAFGRYGIDQSTSVDVAQEKINVVIDGCELKNAREFLLKIGTNRYKSGTISNPSPYLVNQDGQAYTKHNSPECDGYLEDDFFVEQYVLNDVTLKDSTLSASGLFTIGVESHFAGEMLTGNPDALGSFAGFKDLFDGWENLAATSYPAVLRLVGNVVLNDWKNLDSIDSSTLIEVSEIDWLRLDIKEMLKAIQQYGTDGATGINEFENLIYAKDGKHYAHGGIAFYGGGKNYSLLDTSQYTFEQMNQYLVNISTLNNENLSSTLQMQGSMLPQAAGLEDFRFVMFDATSNYKP